MTALVNVKNKQIVYLRWRSAVQQNWLCLILLFAITQIALSQTINVGGKVTSSGNDITVPGCYALVTFTDQNNPSKTFSTITDSSGKYELSIVTKVIPQPFVMQKNIDLEQNYPNPFNPTTVVSYQLLVRSRVTLTVFDLSGREITVLVDEEQEAGKHRREFNTERQNLSSGVYLVEMRVYKNNSLVFKQTKKLSLIK